MRLSTKGRHAITAMLELTLHAGNGPVTLAEISKNQVISVSYLEQLFACLRSKQLVRGVRGPGGGYYLGRAAEEISIADIVCAVDEWIDLTRRGSREDSQEANRLTTHDLWDDLSNDIYKFLSGITLAELVARGGDLKERDCFKDEQTGVTSDLKLFETEAA